jgi:hypothetical protein
MRVPLRLLIAALALTAFLLADAGEAPALPMAKTSGALVTVDEGTQVARRRKRRKRRRTLRRTTRIEFDAQLIKGQTTKAGEVQILERKDTELKSMVKRRTSFREEIIHTVFPEK